MELEIVKGIQSLANSFFDGLFSIITLLGEEIFFFLAFLGLYWCYKKEFAFKYGLFYIVSFGVNEGVKGIFKRQRPWQSSSDIINKKQASGYSFPSGHSQHFAYQATFFGLELENKKKKTKAYWITASVFAFLLIFSRMYLGQHYLSDVICGLALGVGVAFALNYIMSVIPSKFKEKVTIDRILVGLVPIVLLLFCLIAFANILPKISQQILFYKFIGGYLGMVCGYFIDKLVIKYDERVEKWWHNIVKYVLGIGITIGLYYLLMAFYIDLTCYYALVFFIIAFVASTIIPIIFQMIFKNNEDTKEDDKKQILDKSAEKTNEENGSQNTKLEKPLKKSEKEISSEKSAKKMVEEQINSSEVAIEKPSKVMKKNTKKKD